MDIMYNKSIDKKIAILIISCDKYGDLWETCAKTFDYFWPDCKYDKFITSNHKKCNQPGFKSILVGDDLSWSHGLKSALTKLETEYDYVFTMVEDYFFIETINNSYIEKMFNEFIKLDGNFLSLFKLPSKLSFVNKFFGELENNIPYRQSIGFTLWNINTLNAILDPTENAWEFEKIGVQRGFNYDKFYGTYFNYKVLNLVIKGKIVPSSYSVLIKIFPDLNFSRAFFSKKEWYISVIKSFFISNFLFYSPAFIKKRIYFNFKK